MIVAEYILNNASLIPNMDYLVIKGQDTNVTYSTGKFGQDLVIRRFGTREIKDVRITLTKTINIEVA